MKTIIALFAGASLWVAGASLWAQAPLEMTVRLTAPLTTKMNRTGDMVVAKIVQPAQYAGGYLEGEVKDIHPGAGSKRAEIFFQFQTLHVGGKDSPVNTSVTKIANSKQQAEMDEDGAVIEQEHGGRLSQLAGGLTSRISKGAKPLSSSELVKLSAKSTNVSLASGSELTVQFSIPASK